MRRGFTLLEVMVAITILALSLTAIFSSQAGAIKMAHKSRKMGIAALLARCKMLEIEEQIAEEGLPALFASGDDECCEEAEVEAFSCHWEIHPVLLPDGMFEAPEDDALAAFAPANDEGSEPGAAPTGASELLSGGAMDGLAGMAMQFVYPALKTSFETQVRTATVTVNWKEGSRDHSFDVTQYLVSDQGVVPEPMDPNATGAPNM